MILGVTGHRPPSLGGYDHGVKQRAIDLARSFLLIWQPDEVITGMAQGWDTAVAWAAHQLGIPFRAYLPGEWQPDAWPAPAREHYQRLLGLAASVQICVAGPYDPGAMQIRNMRIVDDCDLLLALWNGQRSGGTWRCLEYATRRRAVPKPMVNLWPVWADGEK